MTELIKGVQRRLIACGRSVFYAFGLDRLTRPAAVSAQERRSAGASHFPCARAAMSIRAWLGRRFSSPPESSLRTAARRAATRSDCFAHGRYNARPLRRRALTLSAAFCLLLSGLPVGAQAQTPTVSLRSGDSIMTEGNASNTATFTIALSRRLGAGEVIHIPIELSSPDGARLPGQTDNDFTVSVAGTGVGPYTAGTGEPSTLPIFTFTGHDTNTVQTATATLTPVAGRADGNARNERISASLLPDATRNLLVRGGDPVTRYNFDNSVVLTLRDVPLITISTDSPPVVEGANVIFNPSSG